MQYGIIDTCAFACFTMHGRQTETCICMFPERAPFVLVPANKVRIDRTQLAMTGRADNAHGLRSRLRDRGHWLALSFVNLYIHHTRTVIDHPAATLGKTNLYRVFDFCTQQRNLHFWQISCMKTTTSRRQTRILRIQYQLIISIVSHDMSFIYIYFYVRQKKLKKCTSVNNNMLAT